MQAQQQPHPTAPHSTTCLHVPQPQRPPTTGVLAHATLVRHTEHIRTTHAPSPYSVDRILSSTAVSSSEGSVLRSAPAATTSSTSESTTAAGEPATNLLRRGRR
jgi:hypothetical protein